MARQKKPTVTTRCVAESYNLGRDWSRIVEFSGQVGGGLIDIQDWTVDGRAFVRVDLNRLDDDVRVRLDPKHLDLTPNQQAALAHKLGKETRELLHWLICNLLNESQLDVVPPGYTQALRHIPKMD